MKKVSASIPGEPGLPIIGQLFRFRDINNLMDIAYSDFKKFQSPTKAFIGHVLLVCFSEPKQIQTILNSLNTAEKPFQYKFADVFSHEGLITASHERWKVTRKLLNPTFNQKILQSYADIFLEQSTLLVQKLRRETNKDHFDITQYVTRNVIGSVSQTLLEYNNEDLNTDFFNIMEKVAQGLIIRGFSPWLYPDFIYNRTKLKQEINEGGTKIHAYLSQVRKLNY
ncbi:Cytochrome P450 313b1 [Carabus blaptoides fortunei]